MEPFHCTVSQSIIVLKTNSGTLNRLLQKDKEPLNQTDIWRKSLMFPIILIFPLTTEGNEIFEKTKIIQMN